MVDEDENMVVNAVDPREDDEEMNENNVPPIVEDTNATDAEYVTLNAQLDQLNCVLDSIEMKNDVIYAEFAELLKSNRETRRQFQESSKDDASTSTSSSSTTKETTES